MIAVLLLLVGDVPQPASTIAVVWGGFLGATEAITRGLLMERFFAAARRRGQLFDGLLRAEELERQRLAAQLHDDALQLLLVARQDLVEAAAAVPGAARLAVGELDQALATIARTASELDVGEGAAAVAGGLREGLARVAGQRRGPLAQIAVDPAAEGLHDGLLVQLARELYVNVVKHASARHMQIRVSRQPDAVVLEVLDDGVGFDAARVAEAADHGHIGLATVRERARAAGGTVLLHDAPGGGARVEVRLPEPGAPRIG